MKKKVPMICNIVSVVLVIAFIVKNVVDYSKYTSTLNSAPFYVWILANALYLIIPAIILFAVGAIIKKNQQQISVCRDKNKESDLLSF